MSKNWLQLSETFRVDTSTRFQVRAPVYSSKLVVKKTRFQAKVVLSTTIFLGKAWACLNSRLVLLLGSKGLSIHSPENNKPRVGRLFWVAARIVNICHPAPLILVKREKWEKSLVLLKHSPEDLNRKVFNVLFNGTPGFAKQLADLLMFLRI